MAQHQHYISCQYHFLSNKFSSFSSNEEVDILLGLQHLCSPRHTNHSSQPLGIIPGVEDSASPGGFLSSAGGFQHVTDFTVEVGVSWQFIENQIPDPFYGIPFVEMEALCEEQKLLLSLKEEVSGPGNTRLRSVLADVGEVQFFLLEVVSETHEVKVGGDIDERMRHDCITILRQNLVHKKIKPGINHRSYIFSFHPLEDMWKLHQDMADGASYWDVPHSHLALEIDAVLAEHGVDLGILQGPKKQSLAIVLRPTIEAPHPHSGEVHSV